MPYYEFEIIRKFDLENKTSLSKYLAKANYFFPLFQFDPITKSTHHQITRHQNLQIKNNPIKKLLRITTVPLSLVTLLKGQPQFFTQNNFDVLTVSASGKEVQRLTNSGVRHKSIWLTRKITPIRDLIAVVQLVIIILKFKPTIVHTHTPKAGLVGMLAAWICRVPVRMHTIAGIPWINQAGFRRSILKQVEKITYILAHQVYPNSKRLFQFLESELHFSPSKTKVIGRGSTNGIDVDFFKQDDVLRSKASAIRIEYNIPAVDIVFSFVGRVVLDKGIVELIDAFTEIKKTLPVWLIIIGDFEPDLDPLPLTTLQTIKSNPNIVMAGFQNDVRPWLLASDVFVFPSHREGFPNGVMQACCLELPVIATDINGCNEIIENNISGLLIPVNNKEELRNAMLRLINDWDVRNKFGKRAREFVALNFSQMFVWQELLNEYNFLSSKSNPQVVIE